MPTIAAAPLQGAAPPQAAATQLRSPAPTPPQALPITPAHAAVASPSPAVATPHDLPPQGAATEPQALAAPMARTAHPTPPSHPTPPMQAHTPYPTAGVTPQILAAGQAAVRPRREAATVHVVGFWRRLVAAVIDLAVVVPAALIVALIASWVTGLRLPENLHLVDVDLWIDLVLATDPALVMGLVLFGAIGLTYLLVFQIIVGRTLGMRVMHIKIIDVYGDRPSAARCVARCGGYLAGVATLFLGFLWMGFDSEKRGLQDWIAGTLVIRA
jgi:uncharacterized RDD family membrane protein YckC